MSLAFLLLGIATVGVTAMQNGGFGVAGELLTERIRQRALAAILRQDSSFFDYEEHSVGALTASLARDAQQVQGASGAILATILQVIVNLVACVTVSVAYGWKLALVGVCGRQSVVTAVFGITVSYFPLHSASDDWIWPGPGSNTGAFLREVERRYIVVPVAFVC